MTYYAEGDNGFQAKVRYKPTLNGSPPIPYVGPESHTKSDDLFIRVLPVHEPRRPHYPPPYEPVYDPRRSHVSPLPSESLYFT